MWPYDVSDKFTKCAQARIQIFVGLSVFLILSFLIVRLLTEI